MIRQFPPIIFLLSVVCISMLGCAKTLVPFETMDEQDLTIDYDVEGRNAAALKAGLEKLDFIQLVEDTSADRILTGSAGGSTIDVTFAHSSDGSSILTAQAETVEQCVEKLQPVLMNQYVLKTLSRARTTNQPFKMEVKTDRDPDDPYRATEFIQFRVKSEKPCYLTLLEIAPNGKINILFPNSYSTQQQIEPGKWYQIPEVESPFKIQIDPYSGQAIVWAVGNENEPLDLQDMTGYRVEDADGYITLSHQECVGFLRKLFPVVFPSRAVVVGEPWATAYTVYRVE